MSFKHVQYSNLLRHPVLSKALWHVLEIFPNNNMLSFKNSYHNLFPRSPEILCWFFAMVVVRRRPSLCIYFSPMTRPNLTKRGMNHMYVKEI